MSEIKGIDRIPMPYKPMNGHLMLEVNCVAAVQTGLRVGHPHLRGERFTGGSAHLLCCGWELCSARLSGEPETRRRDSPQESV
jgi:hypothetical protein